MELSGNVSYSEGTESLAWLQDTGHDPLCCYDYFILARKSKNSPGAPSHLEGFSQATVVFLRNAATQKIFLGSHGYSISL